MVKFIRPKPIELAPREEHERLLLVHRPLDPLEAGRRAALSMGDVHQARAFWTTGAEETLLALSCPEIVGDSLPSGPSLPLAPPHPPRGRRTDRLLLEVRLCPKQRRDTGVPLTLPGAQQAAGAGPPPGSPQLTVATGARHGRRGTQGAAIVGTTPAPPRYALRTGPAVRRFGTGRHTQPAGPSGVAAWPL